MAREHNLLRAWRSFPFVCRICIERRVVWRITKIIQTSTVSECPISALVVVPDREFLLAPPGSRSHQDHRAEGMFDGTVWMLILRGQVWSGERLHPGQATRRKTIGCRVLRTR